MKAGIYVRISRDVTGQALGVQRQEEDCRALADKLGWEIVEAYVDNDISATSGKARPSYRRLLADIEAGRIAAIVAWAPDRLYRKLTDLEQLVPVIEDNRVAVQTVKQGDLDLTSAYGRMIARILGAVATGEGEIKAERWKRSWRQRRERGDVTKAGRRMFGYTRDGLIVPDEAEHARTAAAELLSGVPLVTIIRRWEAEGIRTTGGSVWTTVGLRQYLSNPRLAGWSTLKGEIVAEGNWEPIVDRETWETLRAFLMARKRSSMPRVAILNGLIFCGVCDHRLITGHQRSHRIYRCPPSTRPGMSGCGGVSGNAEAIETIVESYARARIDDARVRERLASLGHTSVDDAREVIALEERLVELEAQLDQPGVPVATIMRAMDRTRERMAELQTNLAVAAPVALPQSGTAWPEDVERRARLIAMVVRRVTLLPVRHGGTFNPERVQIEPA